MKIGSAQFEYLSSQCYSISLSFSPDYA
uniref:Uncharacterized protein n=1 Tax=Arundo donax TaxID=35708 RepID=A0A0A9BFY7_ARUDO